MGIHQIGVCRAVLQRLEGITHTARYIDCLRGIDNAGIHLAEALPGAQIHPSAEYAAGGHGNVLVPRLSVDTTRYAAFGIEGDVVLHRSQVGQAKANLLRSLPVFLEPSAGIAVHR